MPVTKSYKERIRKEREKRQNEWMMRKVTLMRKRRL